MRRWMVWAALFMAPACAQAALVTVAYRGTVTKIDPELAGGPYALGQTISGTYSYENDPALNPDGNPGAGLGQYRLFSVSPIQIGATRYPATTTTFTLNVRAGSGLDRWTALILPRPALPAIGSYTAGLPSVLLEAPGNVFANDSLPAAPPPLAAFTSRAEFQLLYGNAGELAFVRAALDTHEVLEGLSRLAFSGPVFDVLPASGGRYGGIEPGDTMAGELRFGLTATGSSFVAPDGYAFPSARFFGTLLGDGRSTSTQGSARPLEVIFSDDLPATQEIVEVLQARTGLTIAPGTPVDLAEIETDVTTGDHRIEFGVSFLALDTSVLEGSRYQAFPRLEDVDIAVYFVVEEIGGVEVVNILGEITAVEDGAPAVRVPVLPPAALAAAGLLLGAAGLVLGRRRAARAASQQRP